MLGDVGIEGRRNETHADQPDAATAVSLQLLDDLFGVKSTGVAQRGDDRHADPLDDAAERPGRRIRRSRRRGTTPDRGHLGLARKDDRNRVVVQGRHVGEPLDIAAQKVSAVLDDQEVQLFDGHCVPNRGPSPLELAVGDTDGNSETRFASIGHVEPFPDCVDGAGTAQPTCPPATGPFQMLVHERFCGQGGRMAARSRTPRTQPSGPHTYCHMVHDPNTLSALAPGFGGYCVRQQ